ncbi:hypothetical protein H696_06346, partial [Fonticula alba]
MSTIIPIHDPEPRNDAERECLELINQATAPTLKSPSARLNQAVIEWIGLVVDQKPKRASFAGDVLLVRIHARHIQRTALALR